MSGAAPAWTPEEEDLIAKAICGPQRPSLRALAERLGREYGATRTRAIKVRRERGLPYTTKWTAEEEAKLQELAEKLLAETEHYATLRELASGVNRTASFQPPELDPRKDDEAARLHRAGATAFEIAGELDERQCHVIRRLWRQGLGDDRIRDLPLLQQWLEKTATELRRTPGAIANRLKAIVRKTSPDA